MKRMIRALGMLATMLALGFVFASCGGGGSSSDSEDDSFVDFEEDSSVDFKEQIVNEKWSVRTINGDPGAITVISKTNDSITFKVNKAIEFGHGQVVFEPSGRQYENGTDYFCYYNVKGPAELNGSWWFDDLGHVVRDDVNSGDENDGFIEIIANMTSPVSASGIFLFFPTTPGEYTIKDIEIGEVTITR